MRKQNMAGRIALAAATVLLCAVFVTTSVLSTTFAKYTTTGEVDSETARVAKWGIKLSNSSNADTEWSVVENENSIMAASSGSTDNIIAPGTSGYLACFRVEGNPEVAHNVTMNFNVTIGDGYKNLIGQDDYFPILISVGRASYDEFDKIIGTPKEIHYYVPKSGIDTLENLISSVDSETFTDERIAPNGWSGSAYAEYYIRWDWFYNAYDVPSYIPDPVKTALAEYQRSGKDTLLSKAMVLQLGKEKVKGSIETLKTALATAKTALDGTPTKTDVTNLENALAAYLGVLPRTHNTTGYNYDSIAINWKELRNQGLMVTYDNHVGGYTGLQLPDYFTVSVGTDSHGDHGNYIYSTQTRTLDHDLCYFTSASARFPITSSTYYEYTFKAANRFSKKYAGVVFATNSAGKPYFYYGGFDNRSDPDNGGSEVSLGYCTYPGNSNPPDCVNGVYEENIFVTIENINNRNFGLYKVVYNGLKVSAQYMNTDGEYEEFGNFTITDGSSVAFGVLNRDANVSDNDRTSFIRDAVVTTRTTVTAKSVLQGLVNEVQAIVDAHSTERDFTISANATIAITQTKSEPNP